MTPRLVRKAICSSAAACLGLRCTGTPVWGQPPARTVIEVLGRDDDPGIDIEIIIRKHRLPWKFPARVLEEAGASPDRIGEDEIRGRLDLRDQLTVTIDGETARDF